MKARRIAAGHRFATVADVIAEAETKSASYQRRFVRKHLVGRPLVGEDPLLGVGRVRHVLFWYGRVYVQVNWEAGHPLKPAVPWTQTFKLDVSQAGEGSQQRQKLRELMLL